LRAPSTAIDRHRTPSLKRLQVLDQVPPLVIRQAVLDGRLVVGGVFVGEPVRFRAVFVVSCVLVPALNCREILAFVLEADLFGVEIPGADLE
jgi:hypothetical protein